jgi:hypothetical protein
MERKLAIELTLRSASTGRSDDTAGYGIVIEERQLPRQAFLLTPIVIQGFNPQPDPPVAAQGQDVRGFTKAAAEGSDDTAGYAFQAPQGVVIVFAIDPNVKGLIDPNVKGLIDPNDRAIPNPTFRAIVDPNERGR